MMAPARILRLALPLLAASAAAARADPSGVTVNVPARNWHMSLWTRDGFLSMTLRGSEVRPVGANQIDITDMDITVFSGDPARRVGTILISPSATFLFRERRAYGPGEVRVIDYGDGVEITGRLWTYEEQGKKVSIHRGFHIIYRAPFNLISPPAP